MLGKRLLVQVGAAGMEMCVRRAGCVLPWGHGGPGSVPPLSTQLCSPQLFSCWEIKLPFARCP